MKPLNLLVFRNQQIKLGDFGISLKLEDEDTDENQPLYYGKGLTPGYATNVYEEAYGNETKLSKKQLFDNDIFALIKTFQMAIDKVNNLEKVLDVKPAQMKYKVMIQDLKKLSL